MRSYPANSPQAAARILALTVFADGDLGSAETQWLDRQAVHEKLGLARHDLSALLDGFHEDLSSSDFPGGAGACSVDERTLVELLSEIQDPELRRKLLRLCIEVAEVDGWVDEGESIVLSTAVEHWGLHHEMFRSY